MSLYSGNYLIRFAPQNVSIGVTVGLYATHGDQFGSPVTAEALVSPQVWRVEANTNPANTYIITEPVPANIHIGPVIAGFGLDFGTSNTVIYEPSTTNWVLTQVDAADNTYIIQTQDHDIGSIKAITVNNGQLVVEQIALGDNKDPLPQWQFVSQDDLD